MNRLCKGDYIILAFASILIMILIVLNTQTTINKADEVLNREIPSSNYVARTVSDMMYYDYKFVGIEENTTEIVEAKVEEETITHINEKVQQQETFEQWVVRYCNSKHISPYLVLSLIQEESGGNAEALGDNGNSKGLMQIQERFHKERMARLGVTDIMDPKQNVIVGVDILLELFGKNDNVYWVLMAYNGGIAYANRQTYVSQYALNIVARSEEKVGID